MKTSSFSIQQFPKNKMLLVALTMLTCLVIALAGCNSASTEGDDTDNKTVEQSSTVGWSQDDDCAQCHIAELSSLETTTCLYSKHASLACSTCHSDTETLIEVHSDGKTDVSKAKLRKTKVSSTTCLSCHKESELISATAESTTLTDSEGLTVNPHDVPKSEEHTQALSCVSCHEVHVEDANLEKQAQKACSSCHHANVYACNTCH